MRTDINWVKNKLKCSNILASRDAIISFSILERNIDKNFKDIILPLEYLTDELWEFKITFNKLGNYLLRITINGDDDYISYVVNDTSTTDISLLEDINDRTMRIEKQLKLLTLLSV